MVHLGLPGRLKSYTATSSQNNSRNPSPNPTMRSKGASETMPPTKAKENGLMLKVVVMKARNLAPKDKNGTSDPYLVLTLGDSKSITQSVPKTLNPEWNMVCEMPVSGVDSLLFECVCWDKDRFRKEYMGEFDLALEEIFTSDKHEREPKWYPLKSKKSGKKSSVVSGEVKLQFSIYDSSNTGACSKEIMEKFWNIAGIGPEAIQNMPLPSRADTSGSGAGLDEDEDIDDIDEDDEEPSDETDDMSKPGAMEKRRRKLRINGLKKRKKQQRTYEFSAGGDLAGIVFLEIGRIRDLPPERNVTRTSFDMDPFVVASLGKKTFRTRIKRHELNPVYNEKMIFQVLKNEQSYSMSFTVVDRDMLSGNDFVASSTLPLKEIMATAPQANPETGLYELKEPADLGAPPPQQQKSRFKLPLSRQGSSQSLQKLPQRPAMSTRTLSQPPRNGDSPGEPSSPLLAMSSLNGSTSGPTSEPVPAPDAVEQIQPKEEAGDSDLRPFTIPLTLKNKEKWEEKHSPELFIKAKYVPYPALRQQFWRSMLKQYDTDESGRISQVELTTMLDTLGSTLRESTIDGFFQRFHTGPNALEPNPDLSIDEAVICLEDELSTINKQKSTMGEKVKNLMPDANTMNAMKEKLPQQFQNAMGGHSQSASEDNTASSSETNTLNEQGVETQRVDSLNEAGEEGDVLGDDDLNDKGEEHLVIIRECPICHQPRLNRRSDADIVTHIATCASQDWRQVNNLVMGGFVTTSQAQRKWYSKVITKISYGGYKLGANSANILVQDRLTGQVNEERMSVYVRIGIRLLYKGLKSRDMEKKRIRKLLRGMSFKQGVKYDDPASKDQIQKFINFHQLDMSEVLLPVEKFNNFNEFFYRQLKPNARSCSAPDDPRIVVSPADCRSVVFNKMDDATKIWVKGREFSIKRLLGNAYPEDVDRYVNGSLGIFRLAPQDYHRFHIPVDGVLGTPKTIEGEYYTVNPMAIRSALDVYGENVRVCVPIDSVAHGRVMVICVGAMMVGSTVITREKGEEVKRAEELGYFKFGGSTILLLFENGKMKFDDDLVDNSNGALETLLRVGMSIGHHPQAKQHTPDMRKNEADITESEKAEAKRRIEGSMAPERSDDDAQPSLRQSRTEKIGHAASNAAKKMKPPAASLAG